MSRKVVSVGNATVIGFLFFMQIKLISRQKAQELLVFLTKNKPDSAKRAVGFERNEIKINSLKPIQTLQRGVAP